MSYSGDPVERYLEALDRGTFDEIRDDGPPESLILDWAIHNDHVDQADVENVTECAACDCPSDAPRPGCRCSCHE
jgi:hypothetical protein